MTDSKRFVEQHWERAEACPRSVHGEWDKVWCISLGGKRFTRANVPDPEAPSEEAAWDAAAEFTCERLEEIRRVEEDAVLIEEQILRAKIDDLGLEAMRQRNNEKWLRILGRIQEIVDDLKRGLK